MEEFSKTTTKTKIPNLQEIYKASGNYKGMDTHPIALTIYFFQ